MNIVLVIPTYNESENVGKLVPAIVLQFTKFPQHIFKILFVDDMSPDGTGEIIKELSKKYKNVFLYEKEKKEGLGAAYMAGFKYAMRELKADALIEMDADFQHEPNDLPKLITAFDEGYDYVLGSRYVKGGSIPQEWALYRKFLSVGGNIFTKFVLGIFNVSDFTTGFKLSRVKGFVDKLDLDHIRSAGFAYKLDLLFRMHKLKAKIKEVPISFGMRDRGDSKMESNNMADSMKVVLMLRYEESKSFFKFIIVGFAGLLTDSGVFSLLRLTLLGSGVSSFVSGFVGMMTTYTLNNIWSFKENKIVETNKKIRSFIIYFVFSYIPIIFRSWLIDLCIAKFGPGFVVEYGAFFVGIFFGLIWNYTVYSKLIWKISNKRVK